MNPQITVLMAVYNSEKYLREAIDSVLTQSFSNFEFLIIDDGSTDSTLSIIKSYEDRRIRLIPNPINIGLTKSLNEGLKNARGKYIARLDGDDIALPNRLEIQFKYLESHPEIALIGSGVQCIQKDGTYVKTIRNLTDPAEIKFELLFENTFVHSSIFFNKQMILGIGGYDENFRHSQDYELYSRLIQTKTICNIPEILVQLRLHDESVVAKPDSQKIVYANALSVMKRGIERYMPISEAEFDILVHAAILKKPWTSGTFLKIWQAHRLLKKIFISYIQKEKLDLRELGLVHRRFTQRRRLMWKLYLIHSIKNDV